MICAQKTCSTLLPEGEVSGQSLEWEERPPVHCEQDTDVSVCLISVSKEDFWSEENKFLVSTAVQNVKTLTNMTVFVLLKVIWLGFFFWEWV